MGSRVPHHREPSGIRRCLDPRAAASVVVFLPEGGHSHGLQAPGMAGRERE